MIASWRRKPAPPAGGKAEEDAKQKRHHPSAKERPSRPQSAALSQRQDVARRPAVMRLQATQLQAREDAHAKQVAFLQHRAHAATDEASKLQQAGLPHPPSSSSPASHQSHSQSHTTKHTGGGSSAKGGGGTGSSSPPQTHTVISFPPKSTAGGGKSDREEEEEEEDEEGGGRESVVIIRCQSCHMDSQVGKTSMQLLTDGWAWRRPTESEKGLPFVYGECPFCFAPNRDHERRKGLGEANEMARSLELKEQLHQTGLAVELEAQRSAKAIAGQRGEQIHVIDKRFEKRLLGRLKGEYDRNLLEFFKKKEAQERKTKFNRPPAVVEGAAYLLGQGDQGQGEGLQHAGGRAGARGGQFNNSSSTLSHSRSGGGSGGSHSTGKRPMVHRGGGGGGGGGKSSSLSSSAYTYSEEEGGSGSGGGGGSGSGSGRGSGAANSEGMHGSSTVSGSCTEDGAEEEEEEEFTQQEIVEAGAVGRINLDIRKLSARIMQQMALRDSGDLLETEEGEEEEEEEEEGVSDGVGVGDTGGDSQGGTKGSGVLLEDRLTVERDRLIRLRREVQAREPARRRPMTATPRTGRIPRTMPPARLRSPRRTVTEGQLAAHTRPFQPPHAKDGQPNDGGVGGGQSGRSGGRQVGYVPLVASTLLDERGAKSNRSGSSLDANLCPLCNADDVTVCCPACGDGVRFCDNCAKDTHSSGMRKRHVLVPVAGDHAEDPLVAKAKTAFYAMLDAGRECRMDDARAHYSLGMRLKPEVLGDVQAFFTKLVSTRPKPAYMMNVSVIFLMASDIDNALVYSAMAVGLDLPGGPAEALELKILEMKDAHEALLEQEDLDAANAAQAAAEERELARKARERILESEREVMHTRFREVENFRNNIIEKRRQMEQKRFAIDDLTMQYRYSKARDVKEALDNQRYKEKLRRQQAELRLGNTTIKTQWMKAEMGRKAGQEGRRQEEEDFKRLPQHMKQLGIAVDMHDLARGGDQDAFLVTDNPFEEESVSEAREAAAAQAAAALRHNLLRRLKVILREHPQLQESYATETAPRRRRRVIDACIKILLEDEHELAVVGVDASEVRGAVAREVVVYLLDERLDENINVAHHTMIA